MQCFPAQILKEVMVTSLLSLTHHCPSPHKKHKLYKVAHARHRQPRATPEHKQVQQLGRHSRPPAPKNLVMDPWPSLRGPSSKSEAATARRVQGMASVHFWNSFMTASQMTGAVGPAFKNLGIGQDLLRSPLPQPPPPPPLQQTTSDEHTHTHLPQSTLTKTQRTAMQCDTQNTVQHNIHRFGHHTTRAACVHRPVLPCIPHVEHNLLALNGQALDACRLQHIPVANSSSL